MTIQQTVDDSFDYTQTFTDAFWQAHDQKEGDNIWLAEPDDDISHHMERIALFSWYAAYVQGSPSLQISEPEHTQAQEDHSIFTSDISAQDGVFSYEDITSAFERALLNYVQWDHSAFMQAFDHAFGSINLPTPDFLNLDFSELFKILVDDGSSNAANVSVNNNQGEVTSDEMTLADLEKINIVPEEKQYAVQAYVTSEPKFILTGGTSPVTTSGPTVTILPPPEIPPVTSSPPSAPPSSIPTFQGPSVSESQIPGLGTGNGGGSNVSIGVLPNGPAFPDPVTSIMINGVTYTPNGFITVKVANALNESTGPVGPEGMLAQPLDPSIIVNVGANVFIVDTLTGQYEFILNSADFNGKEDFTYNVTHTDGTQFTGILEIPVIADKPIAADVPNLIDIIGPVIAAHEAKIPFIGSLVYNEGSDASVVIIGGVILTAPLSLQNGRSIGGLIGADGGQIIGGKPQPLTSVVFSDVQVYDAQNGVSAKPLPSYTVVQTTITASDVRNSHGVLNEVEIGDKALLFTLAPDQVTQIGANAGLTTTSLQANTLLVDLNTTNWEFTLNSPVTSAGQFDHLIDQFTYTITSAKGSSSSAHLNIEIFGDKPVAVGGYSIVPEADSSQVSGDFLSTNLGQSVFGANGVGNVYVDDRLLNGNILHINTNYGQLTVYGDSNHVFGSFTYDLNSSLTLPLDGTTNYAFDSVNLVIEDGVGNSSSAGYTFDIQLNPSVVNPNIDVTQEPSGNLLTGDVSGWTLSQSGLSFTDLKIGTQHYSLDSPITLNGDTVTIHSDGTFSFSGTTNLDQTFILTVSDGQGGTAIENATLFLKQDPTVMDQEIDVTATPNAAAGVLFTNDINHWTNDNSNLSITDVKFGSTDIGVSSSLVSLGNGDSVAITSSGGFSFSGTSALPVTLALTVTDNHGLSSIENVTFYNLAAGNVDYGFTAPGTISNTDGLLTNTNNSGPTPIAIDNISSNFGSAPITVGGADTIETNLGGFVTVTPTGGFSYTPPSDLAALIADALAMNPNAPSYVTDSFTFEVKNSLGQVSSATATLYAGEPLAPAPFLDGRPIATLLWNDAEQGPETFGFNQNGAIILNEPIQMVNAFAGLDKVLTNSPGGWPAGDNYIQGIANEAPYYLSAIDNGLVTQYGYVNPAPISNLGLPTPLDYIASTNELLSNLHPFTLPQAGYNFSFFNFDFVNLLVSDGYGSALAGELRIEIPFRPEVFDQAYQVPTTGGLSGSASALFTNDLSASFGSNFKISNVLTNNATVEPINTPFSFDGGMLTVNSDGSFKFTGTASQSEQTFQVQVTDSYGGTSTQSITLFSSSVTPGTITDPYKAYTISELASFTPTSGSNLLAGDSSPYGALSIAGVIADGENWAVGANIPLDMIIEGQYLQVGTLVVTATGSFTYTPENGLPPFAATQFDPSFEVVVSDGQGQTSLEQVYLSAPMINVYDQFEQVAYNGVGTSSGNTTTVSGPQQTTHFSQSTNNLLVNDSPTANLIVYEAKIAGDPNYTVIGGGGQIFDFGSGNSIQVDQNGNFYVTQSSYFGQLAIQYILENTQTGVLSATASATISNAPINVAPQNVSFTYSGSSPTTFAAGTLLTNDTAPTGDTLMIYAAKFAGAASYTAIGSGHTFIYGLGAPQITINPDGSMSIAQSSGFGQIVMDVLVQDQTTHLISAPEVVTINDPSPTPVQVTNQSDHVYYGGGTQVTNFNPGTLLANDSGQHTGDQIVVYEAKAIGDPNFNLVSATGSSISFGANAPSIHINPNGSFSVTQSQVFSTVAFDIIVKDVNTGALSATQVVTVIDPPVGQAAVLHHHDVLADKAHVDFSKLGKDETLAQNKGQGSNAHINAHMIEAHHDHNNSLTDELSGHLQQHHLHGHG